MVIRLMPHSDTLLLQLLPVLPVRLLAFRRTGRDGVILENPAHVMEQVCDSKEHIGPATVIEVLQKELGVLISL